MKTRPILLLLAAFAFGAYVTPSWSGNIAPNLGRSADLGLLAGSGTSIEIVLGAWMIASLLLGLLLGRIFRSFDTRGQAEQRFLASLQDKASTNDWRLGEHGTSSFHTKIA